MPRTPSRQAVAKAAEQHQGAAEVAVGAGAQREVVDVVEASRDLAAALVVQARDELDEHAARLGSVAAVRGSDSDLVELVDEFGWRRARDGLLLVLAERVRDRHGDGKGCTGTARTAARRLSKLHGRPEPPGAATSITAVIGFVPKTVGIVTLIKIASIFAGGDASFAVAPQFAKLLWAVAVLTMTVGNLLRCFSRT